jgi:hypothetical protein
VFPFQVLSKIKIFYEKSKYPLGWQKELHFGSVGVAARVGGLCDELIWY